MKQVGLHFFGAEREGICQPVFETLTDEAVFQKILSEKEFREVEQTPLETHLDDIRFDQSQSVLLEAIGSDRGIDISRRILSVDKIWDLYEGEMYSAVLDTFEAMIANGAGNLIVESAYKRKNKMDRFQFNQIARFAAYSSGRIDEFKNHPLINSDSKWKRVVEEEIDEHLQENQNRIETQRKHLFEQFLKIGIKNDPKSLKTYIDTLNQSETFFLSHCIEGYNLDLNAITRFLHGKASVLEFPKDGSRLQLFRNFDKETYLVNTMYTEPADSWRLIAEKLPENTVPFLKESVRGEKSRIYSEYVGLSTDGWERSDFPVFLNIKLDKMVDNVLRAIHQLGYADHRGYRNNYCFYFVDKSNGIPTTDFTQIYKRLGDFRIVVRRIDLDAMKKIDE